MPLPDFSSFNEANIMASSLDDDDELTNDVVAATIDDDEESQETIMTSNVRPKRRFMEVASTHSLTSCFNYNKRRRRHQQHHDEKTNSNHNSTFENVFTNTPSSPSSRLTLQQQQQPREQHITPQSTSSSNSRMNEIYNILVQINPKEYAKAGFRANGYSVEDVRNDAQSRFLPEITTQMKNEYTNEVVNAFRQSDLTKVQQLYQDDKLHCNASNAFGESVLHIAARRGNLPMLKVLLDDVKVDPRQHCDDYGRTALHDACWTPTSEPAFDVIDILLDYAPEHLLLKDKRGFTPLDYIRPKDHGVWLRFLWERKSKLHPSSTTKTTSAASSNDDDTNSQIVG